MAECDMDVDTILVSYSYWDSTKYLTEYAIHFFIVE
jgi:hypothetical protein